MEIGLQSVANGSALKSFQKQNDFTVVENYQKMSHFFGQISFLQFWPHFSLLDLKITKIAVKLTKFIKMGRGRLGMPHSDFPIFDDFYMTKSF